MTITKGYLAQIRIARVEGANNQPVTVHETIRPIPYSSMMSGDYMGKSIVQGMAIDAFVKSSEVERGHVSDVEPNNDVDGGALADMLFQLASLIRDGKFKAIKLSKTEISGQRFINLHLIEKESV